LALIGSVLLETLFSMLLAPVMMLFHSVFVLGILGGRAVGWPPQARGDRGMSWDLALGRHLGQIVLGIAAVAVMGYWAPTFLYWLLPVVAGLLLAPLLAVFSSRRWRMFMTPEERQDQARQDKERQDEVATANAP
jgi:membrane glycosyltransferase